MSESRFHFQFVVDSAHHGLRFDTFLCSRLRNYQSAQFLRMARAGLVFVDGLPCRVDQRLHRGEEVELVLAEPADVFYAPEDGGPVVLYQDAWLMAIDKPAGMLVHPAGPVVSGTVANAVQSLVDDLCRLPGLLRPGIVHRLDRETSGVMLIPLTQESHAGLTQQFEHRAVRKQYLALVEGHLAAEQGQFDQAIGGVPGELRMTTRGDGENRRVARTEYRVLRRLRSTSLVLAQPSTGRKHQIRVHFAENGFPLLGDVLYGGRRGNRLPAGVAPRHALHAVSIEFRHPVTHSPMCVKAPPPPDFWKTLAHGVREEDETAFPPESMSTHSGGTRDS